MVQKMKWIICHFKKFDIFKGTLFEKSKLSSFVFRIEVGYFLNQWIRCNNEAIICFCFYKTWTNLINFFRKHTFNHLCRNLTNCFLRVLSRYYRMILWLCRSYSSFVWMSDMHQANTRTVGFNTFGLLEIFSQSFLLWNGDCSNNHFYFPIMCSFISNSCVSFTFPHILSVPWMVLHFDGFE